jgi:hypothetical protein
MKVWSLLAGLIGILVAALWPTQQPPGTTCILGQLVLIQKVHPEVVELRLLTRPEWIALDTIIPVPQFPRAVLCTFVPPDTIELPKPQAL